MSTVTLGVTGTTLATAESPGIVDNVLHVQFRLNLSNVSTILGLVVNKVDVRSNRRIKVKATSAPAVSVKLITLTVTGNLIGKSFSGTDAVRVTQ